jgi:chemotaxis protein CheD
MSNSVNVRMAEQAIGKDPTLLITIGLGSCVGVALYDPDNKIGGLIHIMLPENRNGSKLTKYADTGIPLLIERLEKYGASKKNIVAKIAGGAHMFCLTDENPGLNIGSRNIEAVFRILAQEEIQIIGSDVGGNYGRTMEFFTTDGTVLIRSYKKEDTCI